MGTYTLSLRPVTAQNIRAITRPITRSARISDSVLWSLPGQVLQLSLAENQADIWLGLRQAGQTQLEGSVYAETSPSTFIFKSRP